MSFIYFILKFRDNTHNFHQWERRANRIFCEATSSLPLQPLRHSL